LNPEGVWYTFSQGLELQLGKSLIFVSQKCFIKSILDIYKCPFFKIPARSWEFDIFVTIFFLSVWSLKKHFSLCEHIFLFWKGLSKIKSLGIV